MRTGIIYKYTSPSGKCYVGQTSSPLKRKSQHKCDAIKGEKSAFHCAIRKYGFDNFTYEEIVTNVPVELLDDLEANIIHMEDAYTVGYNMNEGVAVTEGILCQKVLNKK